MGGIFGNILKGFRTGGESGRLPEERREAEERYIICIGSQWAGTTFLYEILQKCSEIDMHPLVELHYFDTLYGFRERSMLEDFVTVRYAMEYESFRREGGYRDAEHRRILESLKLLKEAPSLEELQYRSLFASDGERSPLVGEISPEYMLMDRASIEAMASVVGRESLVLLLARDPVERFLVAASSIFPGDSRDSFEKFVVGLFESHRAWVSQQDSFNDYEGAYEKFSELFPNTVLLSYEELLSPERGYESLERALGLSIAAGSYSVLAQRERESLRKFDISAELRYILCKRYEKSRSFLSECFSGIYRQEMPSLPPAREDEIERIEKAAIFDERYYLKVAPGVEQSGLSAAEHFALIGAYRGYSPHPLFDCRRYRALYLKASDENPLLHYMQRGWKEGCSPSSRFDSSAYMRECSAVMDGDTDPLSHYITTGRERGCEATPLSSLETLAIDGKSSVVAKLFPQIHSLVRFEAVALSPEEESFREDAMRISFVIPDFTAGGGGHMTIFRIVRYLEFFGHELTIWIDDASWHSDEEEAYDDILRYFQTIGAKIAFVDEDFPSAAEGDIIFATAWSTVYTVESASRFKKRFYLVQDYEPAFYPEGAKRYLAESTYRKDFEIVCAGEWLKKRMEKFGKRAFAFELAVDGNIFFEREDRGNEIPRIAFYGRYFTSRRGVELVLAAFEIMAKRGLKFHVDLFGAELELEKAPYSLSLHGVAAPEELAEIYNAADIGVVFSMSNYSLVPLEMMACGLPVLEYDGESTRSVYPDGTVHYTSADPFDIADNIERMLDSPDSLKSYVQKAREWVSSVSWEGSVVKVEERLRQSLVESGFRAESGKSPEDILVTVVIPTLNGGELFKKVLSRVLKQRLPWRYETLIIDSSSDDGTWEYISSIDSLRVYRIGREEFNHGATRNYAVTLSRGEYVAFLTQDALPSDEYWLYNLLLPLMRHPDAAGAFGRHRAHEDATLFTKIEIERHFEKLASIPLCAGKMSDPERYEKDISYRQMLHFYSDNSSCLRKSVWEKIPYREVVYGEDQLWAQDILDAGYKRVYSIGSIVYHSHEYSPRQQYERSLIEGEFFKRFWGYESVEIDEIDAIMSDYERDIRNIAMEYGLDEGAVIDRVELMRARVEGLAEGATMRHAIFGDKRG
jgi:glycosyltransferase involved in cell wall biosynthesis